MPIPEHPYPGQKWKEIRHDNTVTWLAFWKDPISQKDYKYVWLAANSLFKSDSDLAKYEKARKLKVSSPAGLPYKSYPPSLSGWTPSCTRSRSLCGWPPTRCSSLIPTRKLKVGHLPCLPAACLSVKL